MQNQTVIKEYKNGLQLNLVSCYQYLIDNGWYKSSEIETQDWVIDNVEDDWVIFDCGAHIGYYSMLFAHQAPLGWVYAFEANELTCQYLRNNLEANEHLKLDNIELIQAVLGCCVARKEETLWFAGQGDDGMGKTQGVYDFTTIDVFSEVRQIERLDLIKTDVDGWDFELLLGAEETIKKFRPIIIAEVNYALKWRGFSSEDVLKFMDRVNYTHKVLDERVPNNWLMESK